MGELFPLENVILARLLKIEAHLVGKLAITTPLGIDLYSVSLPKSTGLADEKGAASEAMPDISFRQTILPPSLDLNPVVFRSARSVCRLDTPRLYSR